MRTKALNRLSDMSRDNEWIVRSSAVWSLGKLSDVIPKDKFLQRGIIEQMLEVIDDKDWNARSGAIWTFGRLEENSLIPNSACFR